MLSIAVLECHEQAGIVPSKLDMLRSVALIRIQLVVDLECVHYADRIRALEYATFTFANVRIL